jgi:hypothetical protein
MVTLIEKVNDCINDDNCYEFNGNKVPRVTKILSRCIHSDGLMYWANNLGFKHQSYRKVMESSANIGTQCHNSIDSYLEDDKFKFNSLNNTIEAQNAYNSFLKWFNDINANANVEVLLHEHTLVCKYFGGTLDGLYKINNKIYLVDYKTSNHITFNYCLQLAAYRYMLRNVMGIEIDGCIILQLSKNDISYNECVLNFSDPNQLQYMNDCEMAFLSLVLSYYNINKVEEGFKNIGWG